MITPPTPSCLLNDYLLMYLLFCDFNADFDVVDMIDGYDSNTIQWLGWYSAFMLAAGEGLFLAVDFVGVFLQLSPYIVIMLYYLKIYSFSIIFFPI